MPPAPSRRCGRFWRMTARARRRSAACCWWRRRMWMRSQPHRGAAVVRRVRAAISEVGFASGSGIARGAIAGGAGGLGEGGARRMMRGWGGTGRIGCGRRWSFSGRWRRRVRARRLNALQRFTNFAAQYPTNELAPRAQWWVADHYYGREDFVAAEINYKQVLTSWPKPPSWLMKRG
jgi:hypothetical protein